MFTARQIIDLLETHGAKVLLSQLRALKLRHKTGVLLERADHDYEGHRAAAVREISTAIHALRHGPHHPHPGNHQVKRHHELQKLSDAQLQKAIEQLATVAGQLSPSKSSRAARAVTAIQNAEKELQTALTIK